MSLLELRDVHARYGADTALRGITLTVEAGDFLAILGANGAGKTTTLRAISGSVKTSGDVLLDGERVLRRTPERMARRGVAHLPQAGGTLAPLTVLDNLHLGAWVRRAPSRRDLAHVFEHFPSLYDHRRRRAGTLSGGEQRMLAVGRAMMARPRLLMLDEPSHGLAPLVAHELFTVLRRLNEAGTAIVVVEQRPALALDTARRAVVLDEGRVVLAGAAAELREHDAVRSAYLGR